MNAILDGYPEEYEGYLIRTDFRIGIQICQCMADEDIDIYERFAIAFNLLYGNGIPEFETAYSGLEWFINMGNEKKPVNKKEDTEEEKLIDFDFDSNRILTAFLRYYDVDLESVHMHWFRFLSMLSDIGECAHKTVLEIRKMNADSSMKPKQRAALEEMKRLYSLNGGYTEEVQDKIKDFLEELKKAE